MDTIQQENSAAELVSDIVTWLPTANPDDILGYSKALPMDLLTEDSAFRLEILHSLRYWRNRGLEEKLQTDAPMKMRETELNMLITSLSAYNADSVVEKFKGRYPEVRFGSPLPDTNEWARLQITAWRNVFYLLTARTVPVYVSVLKSLVALKLDKDKVQYYSRLTKKTIVDLITQVDQSNYSSNHYPVDLQQSIRTLLESFKVFPTDVIQEYIKPGRQGDALELLSRIDYCLDTLVILDEAKVDTSNDQLLHANMWRQLALDEQVKEVERYESLRQGILARNARGSDIKFLIDLGGVLAPNQVLNGTAQEQLTAYIGQLNESQKTIFFGELKSFVVLAAEYGAAFDAVDPDYFFKEIHGKKTKEERVQFVNSLQKSVSPEEWPLIKQLFTLIANLYS